MNVFFDNTTGYFSDVPYFTPVETTVFYEAVQSCRLHKLPGHLMVPPRSAPFFMTSGSELANQIGDKFATATGTKTKSASAVLPEFTVDFSSTRPLFKKNGDDFVRVREACPDSNQEPSEANTSADTITLIDVASIGRIWTELISLLNGCSNATSKFCIRYVDIFCTQPSGLGECLVSLLVAGVASILHHYSQKPACASALESIEIDFVVLNTADGASIADQLQFHIENKLKISVRRIRQENFDACYESIISAAQCFKCSSTEWLENVCSEAVDAHEVLCDGDWDECSGKMRSPVVLLVVPQIASVRSALASQILDSYSSEPLRVQADTCWSVDELSKATPVVFMCSAAWLVNEMSVSAEESIFRKLDVRIVLHGGFCEAASAFEEEIVRCAIVLESFGVQHTEMRIAQHAALSFSPDVVHSDADSAAASVQMCGNVLLLLFRRFVMRFSPGSKQPYVSIRRDLFWTLRSWSFFNSSVRTLQNAGIFSHSPESSAEALEMGVLGRFLSFRFRIGNAGAQYGALNLVDGKAILWSFLLRQPLSVVREVVRKSHVFSSWVDHGIAAFCRDYQLAFTSDAFDPQEAVVEQLAGFGFRDGDKQNRVHYLLSSPSGTRFPLRSHLTTTAPTVCRGWYEQAPLNAGLALEKKEVGVVCLPPKALYCEVEAVDRATTSRLQCPLELSYPILVAHSVLHISLHNVCVFSETVEPSTVMPLPVNLLESGVMQFLLGGLVKSNAGLWLDGVMHEIAPAASDASVLAPLALKGKRFIQHCERELFTRKRRRVEAAAEKLSDSGAFQGVLPRTVAERSAVEELVQLIQSIGREKAEKMFRGKKGFNFLETAHELHPFYLYHLKQ